jgi:hypothetical protein
MINDAMTDTKPTCDTCVWWFKPVDEWKLHGVCAHQKLVGGEAGDIDGLDTDEVNCTTGVTSGPKFGCIHHEAKS